MAENNIEKFDKQLDDLLRIGKWDVLIGYIRKSILTENSMNIYVDSIYYIHHVLLEYRLPENIREELSKLLLFIFNESRAKFIENSDYLFFVGYILNIAEWYFDESDRKLAKKFTDRASQLDRDNKLFRFGALLADNRRVDARSLALEINEDPSIREFLLSSGYAGKQIIGLINFVINELI